MKKRILATLLAAMMAVSCFTGCSTSTSNDDSSTDDSTSTDTNADDSTGEDATEEPTAFTIAVQQNSNIEDWETNYFTYYIEELANVDLTFEVYPSSSSDLYSKVALLVSAATELPDIWCFALTSTDIYTYGSKGAIVATQDYLTDEEATPYFNALDEDIQARMISDATVGDGNTYSLPRLNDNVWNEGGEGRMFYYTPWLEALDADLPTTTDEFYELCIRMRDEDPNGNGLADEIAIMGNADNEVVTTYLMNAFVYANPDKYYFMVEDGVISPAFTTDEWYEGLEYINMLYSEGLIDPLTFTQDDTAYQAVLGSVETGIAGFLGAPSYASYKYVDVTHWNVELIAPLEGPDGLVSAAQSPNAAANCWMITSSCENVEKAISLGDEFYNPTTAYSARWGEEGVEWSMDPDIISQYYLASGVEVTLAVMNNLWGSVNNKMWGEIGPTYRSAELMQSIGFNLNTVVLDETNSDPELSWVYYGDYVPAFPEENYSNLPYSNEESDSIAVCKTDIDTYVEEQLIAFVTGTRSLTEWDSYLLDLENMGLETYVEANQSAYDRYIGA